MGKTRKFPFNQVIKRINASHYGTNLAFDGTKATKTSQDYKYSTFAFGQPITPKISSRYDMYVRVNQLEADCFIGFAGNAQGIKDWNKPPGYGGNKNSSVGVLANKTNNFAVYGGANNENENENEKKEQFIHHQVNQKKWDDGSIFVLSFDFANDHCNIYLNQNKDGVLNDHASNDQNKLLKSIKLNQRKSVIPSFSLNYEGDSIEVVKWRLY